LEWIVIQQAKILKPMSTVSFYDVTPLALDNSPNVIPRLISTAAIQHVRGATAGEISNFPTAASAVIFQETQQNAIERSRTLLTAVTYATWKTALQV
jgi:hypothetical protein